MPTEDRRAEPRVDVDLEVQYRSSQEFIAAYAKDISGGGIFIRTQQPLPLNREVTVRFSLPGVARSFVLRGLVVWTNPSPSRSSFPPGMGLKFMDLDPEAKKILGAFVKEKCPPAAPEQEPSGS